MSNEVATTEKIKEVQLFELANRQATALAHSDLVPAQFKGNQANCLLALNMAQRMKCDPMMVMQNTYIIHGKPSLSSQFLIACFNQAGKFSAIKYEFTGVEGQDSWGCRASAIEKETGEKHSGTLVTIAMAKAEGWATKGGSKWKSMPELMMKYRAATFFIRQVSPEIALGFHTDDEIRDIQPESTTIKTVSDLLKPKQEPDVVEGELVN